MRSLVWSFATLLVPAAVTALDPRWGHRATYIESSQAIIIHGGKSDPTSSFSYTSAPNTGETLYLDLSKDSTTTQATWTVLSDDGPTVAWHTLDVFGSGEEETLLVFGGDGGSSLPVQTRTDSTWLVDPFSTAFKNASYQSQTDVEQPIRKVFSASSRSVDGETVYITGGEKNDGSGLGYREAWAVTLSSGIVRYSALPDLPTDLVHHQSIMLPNGTLVLLGGLVPSTTSFLPLSKFHTLDTTDPSARWQTITLSSSTASVPSSRRGHTATLVTDSAGNHVVYLVGGISGSLQGGQVLDDVWRIDLAVGKWEEVRSADIEKREDEVGPGARFDHVAVAVGEQLLVFGGYGSSGPADAALYILDASTLAWTTDFRAPESSSGSASSGSSSVSGSAAGKTAASTQGSHTASTVGKGNKSASQTGTASGSATLSATGKPSDVSEEHKSVNRTAIAIGSTLGALALLALLLACWLFRRRRQRAATRNTLTPFGGRPLKKRRFGKAGRGQAGQGLVSDKLEGPWDASEKDDMISEDDEERLDNRRMYRHSLAIDEGFTDSQHAYGTNSTKPTATTGLGKASPLVSNIAAKIRQVSGRITSNPRQARFSMLEDEDREDLLWKGGKEDSDEEDGYDIHHVREPTEATSSGSESDGGSGGSSARRFDDTTVGAVTVHKELPVPPFEHRPDPSPVSSTYSNPFTEPLDHFYDNNIMSYVNGSVASRAGPPKSSMNSRDSMTESMMADAVQVARKVSVTTAEASYVPLKREETWLQRVAGNSVASLFRGNRQTAHQTEEGFLDPTTPPALESIREDDSRVSLGMPSSFSNFGRSMSSVVSAATANSAFLDRYGQMNIMQREYTPTSQRSRVEHGTGHTDAELPPVPKRANILRPATPPRGPRPAPLRMPTHIDVGTGPNRRPVKDIAASINRRGSAIQGDLLPSSPLAQGDSVASSAMIESPLAESPSRARSSLTGPRHTQTTYQAVPKAPFLIANNP